MVSITASATQITRVHVGACRAGYAYTQFYAYTHRTRCIQRQPHTRGRMSAYKQYA